MSLYESSALFRFTVDTLVPALAGVAIITGGSLYSASQRQASGTVDLATRIDALTVSLNASAQAIADIEHQIGERKELVAKLKQDADTAEKLRQLNSPQVEAIAQTLRGQLDEQERDGRWLNYLMNFLFIVIGILLAEVWAWFKPRLFTRFGQRN